MTHDPKGRWAHQRQRVADVLQQRAEQMRDEYDEAQYRPAWGDRWREMRDHIRAEVDKWPPLTPAQKDRLAVLLRPGIERTP